MRTKKITLLLTVFVVMIMVATVFADDGVIRINFQAAGHPQPLREGVVHFEDSGEAFGDRGNGYNYGWSVDNTGDAVRRYRYPDCRLDGNGRIRDDYWEIALANGNYLVNLGAGDSANDEEENSFKIEGVSYFDPDPTNLVDVHEDIAVTVSDGRLTIENYDYPVSNTKICYIEIVDAAVGFPSKQTYPAEDPSQLAFPTAEGSARNLTGGRGGDVYHVTNLNWTGPGSLNWGFNSTYDDYPRTIVFDVSGHIGCSHPESIYGDINGCYGADGGMYFLGNNITVAGQTAPGKGITIRDHQVSIQNSSNIIMRYFRIRLGDENKGTVASPDGLWSEYNDGLFLDHVSMSWTIDGVWDSYQCGKMSVQWCVFSEPLNDSLHEKGPHGYLMSFRKLTEDISIHHNVFSSGDTRHPTLGSNGYEYDNDMICDFRNNVDYNWGSGDVRIGSAYQNVINNTFRYGPNGFGEGKMIDVQWHMPYPWGYFAGNRWESVSVLDSSCDDYTYDNYLPCVYTDYGDPPDPANRSEFEAFSEFTDVDYVPPVTESADVSFQKVIDIAGCSLIRDEVDERIINNIVNSDGDMIDSQDDVGGWDDYVSQTRPAGFDTDQDGMPDVWETARGLDSSDPNDRNYDDDSDGYTNLEEYLNELVAANVPGTPEVDDSIMINFQPATGSTVPTGYLKDEGSTYGDRGNGQFYGWDLDMTGETRDRGNDSDQRYDTICHMKANWELEIENGDYVVELVMGEPTNSDSINDVLIEGILLEDPDGYDNFDKYSGIDVTVTDGNLNLTIPASADNPKLCFMEIRPYTEEININFQPTTASKPHGYEIDDGSVYADRGNGLVYGWSDDMTAQVRDRGDYSDQRYDTLCHMKATWELEIPNGSYVVDLVCGDPENTDMINDISVEGVLLDDPDGYDKMDEYRGINVTVTDGKLTISEQASAANSKICFIDIQIPVIPPDTDSPTPDPMTFAVAPYATGCSTISMTATTATDSSDVEYYFTCTAGGGNDSGWQDSPTYEDNWLSPETQYTYTVTARDKSANQNSTAASSPASATTEAFLVGWSQSKELIFSGYTGSTTLNDFPVLIMLDSTKIDYADFSANGDDLRFSTSQTAGLIPHEIEVWNTSGISYIWVQVPALSSSTDSIWMHWDNPNASSLAGSYMVWSGNYAAAWHLDGTLDSSENMNDGTNSGTSTVSGLIGNAASFDGSDYISMPTNIGTSGLGSVSFWFKTTHNFTDHGHMFHARGAGGSDGQANGLGSHNELHVDFVSGANTVRGFIEGTSSGNTDMALTSTQTTNDGSWHYLTFTWDQAGQGIIYIDGSQSVSLTHDATVFDFDTSVNLGKPEENVRYYTGDMDEVRLSSVARSADWVHASYLSQQANSTFINYTSTADTDPPTPNPATFAVAPAAGSDSAISMTATTGSDVSGVEYYFDETSGNAGGTDSGWQSSPSYTDTGLTGSTQYTYTVQMRDTLGNIGIVSAAASATTLVSPVTVPDVTGQAQATAESNIVAAGLVVGTVTTAYSGSVPAGDVISQNPAGGSSVQPGTSVDIEVSLGVQMVTVPDVTGQAQATAESNIVSAGLVVGTVTTATSPTVPAGDVISQNPAGSTSVAIGSAVDIEVSLGSSTWVQIISDDFESGLGNWNVTDTESFLYTEGTYAYQGNNALNIQDNNDNSVGTTSNLTLSAYSEVKVDFAYICVSMDNSDEDFWMQISTDGGSNFTTVEEWNLNDEFVNDQFYTDSVTITGYTLTDQTQIRFRCDASGNKDDVYIDTIVISAK